MNFIYNMNFILLLYQEFVKLSKFLYNNHSSYKLLLFFFIDEEVLSKDADLTFNSSISSGRGLFKVSFIAIEVNGPVKHIPPIKKYGFNFIVSPN